MKLLEGKTALITGASRGIGKAIAIRFAEHGANIAFSDLNRDDNMDLLEKELGSIGVKGKGYSSDASSYEQSEKLVDEVLADFGQVDTSEADRLHTSDFDTSDFQQHSGQNRATSSLSGNVAELSPGHLASWARRNCQ